MQNHNNVSPIPASQMVTLITSITGILGMLGGSYLMFYRSVCTPKYELMNSQNQALIEEIRQLREAIKHNNTLKQQVLFSNPDTLQHES